MEGIDAGQRRIFLRLQQVPDVMQQGGAAKERDFRHVHVELPPDGDGGVRYAV